MDKKKIMLACLLALLFVLCSLPKTYTLTDTYLKPIGIRTSFDNVQGMPSILGVFLHAIVFFVLVLISLLLKDKSPSSSPSHPSPPSTTPTQQQPLPSMYIHPEQKNENHMVYDNKNTQQDAQSTQQSTQQTTQQTQST